MIEIPALVLVSELPGAAGGLACAAALAVALATAEGETGPVAFAEVDGERLRGPTMLASEGARALELDLRAAGFEAAARGRLAWIPLAADEGQAGAVAALLDAVPAAQFVVAHLPARLLREAIDGGLAPLAVVLRADLPRQRSLAALAVRELRDDGVAARLVLRAPGRVATRRALAGIDPGGATSKRSARLARGMGGDRGEARATHPRRPRRLASEAGQALPLVLGAMLALIACSLILAGFGGAVTGTSRVQRSADLTALSAARSMRDDFDRLFLPARLSSGAPNPAHLSKPEYLERAVQAAREAAAHNGVAAGRLRVEFPDGDSFAPLHVRAEVVAELDTPGGLPRLPVSAHAEAEAVPASVAVAPSGPQFASGGGYSGRLEYRQGMPMRPDVAAAFDRMEAAAQAAGIALVVNSAFRSDAEQAILFAEHPDPRWVAPPGTSLHRCATELDLGTPAAYAWLAANAGRFGFLQRYSWEPWHYGFTAGPAPCSPEGDSMPPADARGADGESAALSLPAFVPARFREPIATAAGRWNVSATLLAAQLMAESNFNPFAVSPAGAAGIAQFMPATAAAYGLTDPFDAVAAIDAQAHLMSDLLGQFELPALALAAYNAGPGPVIACGCVPAIPETQSYVARILGLIGGAGAVAAPPALEVRLVD